MAVRCGTIIRHIEGFAPKSLAEDWDNIGLQIGSPAQEVKSLYLTLDLDDKVLDDALEVGSDMIVVHHTPFFKPLKNLRSDQPVGRLISKIIQQGIALYTAHTNLDAAQAGVNDMLAHKLGLYDVALLSTSWQQKLYKLVVFVPSQYEEPLRESLSRAGAGWIGRYSDCTFQVQGLGTFRPLDGTNPFLGTQGELAKVEEIRMETIVPEERFSSVLKAMFKAHPYEEVAYDIYPLQNEGKRAGLGRVGYLEKPLELQDFLSMVKRVLGIDNLRYCGKSTEIVRKVALCGGSGAAYIHQAIFAGAQVYLTADIKYHEAQEALSHNLALVDAGHFATEYPIMEVLGRHLSEKLLREQLKITISAINTDPFRYL